MTISEFNRKLKPWILPIAMLMGVLFHNQIESVAFLTPYLIFTMLLITYCKVSFRNIRVEKSMIWLLAIQLIGSIAAYYVLNHWNHALAESIFICILCPTATAAPVITGILGGNVEKVVTYCLIINLAVALLAPIMIAYINENADIALYESMLTIASKVIPLLIGPLVIAFILKYAMPKVQPTIAKHSGITFYIWAIALIIVVGNAVSFVMKEPTSAIPLMIAMGVLSLVACLLQFRIGWLIGKKYGDTIAAAQSLGQKNTILAIWLSLTYLEPIASVGPACYVAWHNIVNSGQIYFKLKRNNENE